LLSGTVQKLEVFEMFSHKLCTPPSSKIFWCTINQNNYTHHAVKERMDKESSLIERMKKVEYFKNLSTTDILVIIRSGEFLRFNPDTTIFYEEAACYGLCVLLRGEINLYKLGTEGQENIIGVIEPVIMFNEVPAIDRQPNAVTAITTKQSLIWRVDCERFHEGLHKFPRLGLGLLPILARRNRKLIEKYADLSFRPVKERLAILLLELSSQGKKEIDRSEHTIQELAAHIASDPVVVSRILGDFRDSGLIKSDRKRIVVLEPAGLAKVALLDLFQVDKIHL
jgi:CRP-like cAMP-binding protein